MKEVEKEIKAISEKLNVPASCIEDAIQLAKDRHLRSNPPQNQSNHYNQQIYDHNKQTLSGSIFGINGLF